MRTVVLLFVTLALFVGGCTYDTDVYEEVTVSRGFDPSDPNWDIADAAVSISGGVSAGEDLVTGQQTPSPGTQAWFKDADGTPNAKAYVVRFGVIPPSRGVTPADNIFDCVATITSTVQGNSITRKVTVGQGVVIEGEAEAVTVTLDDITPDAGQNVIQPDGSTAVFDNPYRVTIIIAPGLRPNYTLPPTLEAFTVQVNSVPSVQSGAILIHPNLSPSAIYLVPPDAGVSSVEVVVLARGTTAVPNFPPIYVQVEGVAGQILKAWDPSVVKGFIALPAGALSVDIVNLQGAGEDAIVTTTWGIEG